MSKTKEPFNYIISDDTVAGVDECATGSLIYDVFAACVVLPSEFPDDKYKLIKDSKKLSAKKRAELSDYIQRVAITFGIGRASHKEIDDMNILVATMKAMNRAINEAYKKKPFKKILVDGNKFNGYVPPGIDADILEHECIIKGDSKYLNISAASIIAKHAHDTSMLQLIEENPDLEKYDLKKCQGYGTTRHIAAIKKYGITEFHRKTFSPCKDYIYMI